MLYKFKTKSYFDAYSLFSRLPFYSFKNLIHKKDLIIKEENIISIDVMKLDDQKLYFLNYKDDFYHGQIQLKNIDINSLSKVKIIHSTYDHDKILKEAFFDFKYWFNSPILYTLVYISITGYGFVYFRHDLFPEILNPKPYINAACSEKCVALTGIGMSVLAFLFLMTVGSLLLGLLLIYLSKYYSNLNHYKRSINYLTLFIAVEALIFFKAVSPLFSDPKILDAVKKMYLIRYDKEYIRTHPRRGIATK